ncbi:TonB-dependent receptor [uncultured Desulfobulbus sp.]|uniref:TonB-dependent receptor plug domain-containing protein n=1 Tax=uncultured Desulfobulbus sp. TaxID=239745 RepID=UPI0029C97209|nr:TonB-dependent receptor [uncultured Desulfobulbus sp.]
MMRAGHTSKFARVLSVLCVGLASQAHAADTGKNEYLDMDIGQLMNITVTSVAKKAQPLSDAAAAVFVITQEDIRRSGVTTIPDALAMAPGLQVAKISASKWSVSSRGFAGFTSNKLLVLMDGRSVYSPAYGGTFWDTQNTLLEDIDRIEVIRGPGGTLWGANAVNGVINIITKKAEDTQGGLVRVGAGTQETFSSAARYGSKIGETTYGRLYLTYDDHASNILKETGTDADDDWQPAQGGFRMDGKPGTGKEWTLQGDLYENSGNQLVFPYWTSESFLPSALFDEIDSKGGNLLGRWHQELGNGRALTFKAYYDYVQRDEAIYRIEFDTIDLDLQYETKLGQRQALTMGAGYRSVQGSFEPTFQVFLPDRNDSLYSAFLQDEINLLADRLWLTLGSKYEQNDYTGKEWQPSAKLLWKPVEHHSYWVSASRAVRTPAILDQYGRVAIARFPQPYLAGGIGTVALVGNPQFDSEIVNAYEAGYRWQATENLSFDLALFYNDYDEIYTVMPSATTAGVDNTFVNAQQGSGRGFELAADWKATSWLSFVLTYSYLELDLTSDALVGSQTGSELVEGSSPQHQASLRSSIALAPDWRLNLWLRYVDDISGRNSADLLGAAVPLDAYCLFDANLIWTPNKNLEVMLAGQNLTNSGQLHYLSEYSTPATEIERGVYGKVTWRF